MSIDLKIIKKNISENWVNSFPKLIAYNQNKFYKVIGNLIVGIEAVNVPNIEGYKPHFVIYPLWKKNIKECLDTPYIYDSIKNNKGAEISIPYIKHQELFKQTIECLHKQIPFSLNNDIELKLLFKYIDSLFDEFIIRSNPAQQAKLLELKFYTALYSENQNEIQNLLKQIYVKSENWNMQMFEIWYGKFEFWFQQLHDKIHQKEEFINQVITNKKEKKIASMNISEFI